jgi:hypothetical protein
MGSFSRTNAETAKRKLEKLRKRQYLRSLLCHRIDKDGKMPVRILVRRPRRRFSRLIADNLRWEAAFRDLKDPTGLPPGPSSTGRSQATRSRLPRSKEIRPVCRWRVHKQLEKIDEQLGLWQRLSAIPLFADPWQNTHRPCYLSSFEDVTSLSSQFFRNSRWNRLIHRTMAECFQLRPS